MRPSIAKFLLIVVFFPLFLTSCEQFYLDPASYITFNVSFSSSGPLSPDSVFRARCLMMGRNGAKIGKVVFYVEINGQYYAIAEDAEGSRDYYMDVSIIPSKVFPKYDGQAVNMKVVFTALDLSSDINFHSDSYSISLKPDSL